MIGYNKFALRLLLKMNYQIVLTKALKNGKLKQFQKKEFVILLEILKKKISFQRK